VLNPTLLVEVLSPSTESDDLGPKLDCYKLIGSLKTVIHVRQDRVYVTVHERRSDGAFVPTTSDGGIVELAAIDCRLPIAELYEDLPEV
jgi:Uma2 family endonuclease